MNVTILNKNKSLSFGLKYRFENLVILREILQPLLPKPFHINLQKR